MDQTAFTMAAVTNDLGVEPTAREDADILEFRMDLATNPLEALETYSGVLPILATNRVTTEGGNAPDTTERLDTLAEAATYDHVHAVDIELETLQTDRGPDLARHTREADATLIASTHDFDGTPSPTTLHELLDTTAAKGDIGKVAVTATDRTDSLSLLSATHDATTAGKSVATIAMGAPGRHTRAIAPVYGSKVAYAPVSDTDTTAPGQFDLATLTTLIRSLR